MKRFRSVAATLSAVGVGFSLAAAECLMPTPAHADGIRSVMVNGNPAFVKTTDGTPYNVVSANLAYTSLVYHNDTTGYVGPDPTQGTPVLPGQYAKPFDKGDPSQPHVYLVTLDPYFFDPVRLDRDLTAMAAAGINTVRLDPGGPFQWLRGMNMPPNTMSPQYMGTIRQFLQLLRNHNMKAIFAIKVLPKNFTDPVVQNPNDPYNSWDTNQTFFDPDMVAARANYIQSFVANLPQIDRDTIFSIDVCNECEFNKTAQPFIDEPADGPIDPLFGNQRLYGPADYFSYDGVWWPLYSFGPKSGRQGLGDQATIDFTQALGNAMNDADPNMMFSISQATPWAAGYPGFNGLGPSSFDNGSDTITVTDYPLSPVVIGSVALSGGRKNPNTIDPTRAVSFLDIHYYPERVPNNANTLYGGGGIPSTNYYMGSADIFPTTANDLTLPLIISEFGQFPSTFLPVVTSTAKAAAMAADDLYRRRWTLTCTFGTAAISFWDWNNDLSGENYTVAQNFLGVFNKPINCQTPLTPGSAAQHYVFTYENMYGGVNAAVSTDGVTSWDIRQGADLLKATGGRFAFTLAMLASKQYPFSAYYPGNLYNQGVQNMSNGGSLLTFDAGNGYIGILCQDGAGNISNWNWADFAQSMGGVATANNWLVGEPVSTVFDANEIFRTDCGLFKTPAVALGPK